MKAAETSKSAVIRHESELAAQFRDLLSDDPDLSWELPAGTPDQRPDRVGLKLDGQHIEFSVVYELKPSLPWLDTLAAKHGPPRPLLVTPELSSRVISHCKQNGIAALDLNGRAWLRAPGLLVDRRPLPGRNFSYQLEPRNIFVGKSARIIRSLLTDRERLWTQAELVTRTTASSGLVSRIVQHLISQGFAEKTSAREFRLRDPLALIDEWAASDRLEKRARTTLYAGIVSRPESLTHPLQQWAARESVPIAFTQWIAAWELHPFTEPPVCSAYVSRLPEEGATLEALGLRRVPEGGKLWLHVPDDEGIFMETQTRHGLKLASDAQIYLDLQRTGLRGPDAAAALRAWDGFCKP